MTGTMTSAGLDVHARSIDAAAICVATGEVSRRRFGGASGPVIGWLKGLPGPVHACYEAGPTGFGLFRAANAAGIRMDVVAPSKTPRAAGERVKTDRKDAELLARLLLAGQLSAVRVPEARMEARRELFRCHEQARGDLMRARHRTSKMLLRHGRVWSGGSTWTQRHRVWLAGQQFERLESELAFADYLATVDAAAARKAALAERLSRLALEEDLWPTVSRLRAFRGIDTLTALGLHLELGGDWARFGRPAQLSAWLGLIPSLHQSGQSATRGAITKTGSLYARRLLVESAWHYRRKPYLGPTLAARQQGVPDQVLQGSWRAQRRLHRVFGRLNARGKPANVATVAVARELSGFLWAAAVAD
ncbi:MAG TPA: IS110 family transposase [Geminicoccaceae bacterium]|jgi:transposase|nr:IS110 family transposase [Geminicoccaceae bacterium]